MSDVAAVPRPRSPMPRSVRVTAIVAAVLMGGGMFLLMGLPGAIYGSLAAWAVELIRGFPAGHIFQGDRGWPLAILLTLVVPPVLPVALWLGLRWFKGRLGLALVLAIAAMWLWSLLALLVLTSKL